MSSPPKDKQRTVLHVRIAAGAGGGPEKTIINSPRHLTRLGYRGLVAYLHPPGDPGFEVIQARAAEKECPLTGFPESLPIDPRVLMRLYKLCRRERVDVWHGHDYKSNLYGVLLRPFLGFQLVTTVHGWVKHTKRTPLYYGIDRWTLPKHHAVIAVSSDLHAAATLAGVPASKLFLVENAIDTDEFQRVRPRRTEGPLRIGAVGRLSEEKGFDLLIQACERLLDQGLELELAIAGAGDREAALADQVKQSKHASQFHLLGYETDTKALFDSFDVFCLSSLREGLPNVVLEAMSMALPVVATRSGGMDTFTQDGEDGILIDPGSVDELESGLGRVLRDVELQTKLANGARKRVLADCSFTRRMEQIAAIYDGLSFKN